MSHRSTEGRLGVVKKSFLEEVALLRPLLKRWDLNQWKRAWGKEKAAPVALE